MFTSVATLPHRICAEQIFYFEQGKGSRRVIFKDLHETPKDELIKIAGNLASFERLRENEAYLRLDFYKFIRKHRA